MPAPVLIVAVAVAVLIIVVGVVDALQADLAAFERAGRSLGAWIGLMLVFGPLAVLLYFATVRHDVRNPERVVGPNGAAADSAIDVAGLEVRYGELVAVRGIDLVVPRGEVFALLGPNGAGKTSTLEVLEGFRRRSSGDVSVLGADPASAGASWRARIGFMLQESEPDPDLTAEEVIDQFAGYYPNPRPLGELVAQVGLSERAGHRCSKLSGGEHRRLELALALVGSPELVFLDEPTTGFDPAARRRAWDTIAALTETGVTVLLTTHQMDEAQYLADTIAVIVAGSIVAQGTAADLAREAALLPTVSWAAAEPPADASTQHAGAPLGVPTSQQVAGFEAKLTGQADGARWKVETDDVGAVLKALLGRPDAATIMASVEVRQPSLEDSYLALVAAHGGDAQADYAAGVASVEGSAAP